MSMYLCYHQMRFTSTNVFLFMNSISLRFIPFSFAFMNCMFVWSSSFRAAFPSFSCHAARPDTVPMGNTGRFALKSTRYLLYLCFSRCGIRGIIVSNRVCTRLFACTVSLFHTVTGSRPGLLCNHCGQSRAVFCMKYQKSVQEAQMYFSAWDLYAGKSTSALLRCVTNL